MEPKVAEYGDANLTYYALPGGDLLIDTNSFCAIAEIPNREIEEELRLPTIDLTSAILYAHKYDKPEFAEWLQTYFAGYNAETYIRPNG